MVYIGLIIPYLYIAYICIILYIIMHYSILYFHNVLLKNYFLCVNIAVKGRFIFYMCIGMEAVTRMGIRCDYAEFLSQENA